LGPPANCSAAPVFGIIHLHTPHSDNQAGETRRDSIPYTHSGCGSLFFLARIQLEQLLCFAVLSSRLFLLPPIFIRLLRPHIKFIHSSAIYSAVCTCCCWMRASECVSVKYTSSLSPRAVFECARGALGRIAFSLLLFRSRCSTLYTVCCGERKGVAAPVQIKTKRLLCGF
jgi:hypothetical protein